MAVVGFFCWASSLPAEEFQLADGAVLDGAVTRRTATSVTIQHSRGVGTFGPEAFAPATRDRLFSKVAQAVAREAPPTTETSPARRTWADWQPTEKVQTICLLLGAVAIIVAEVWFIVAAFSVSTFWGVVILLFGGLRSISGAGVIVVQAVFLNRLVPFPWTMSPFTFAAALAVLFGIWGVIFIFRHWRQAMGPVSVELAGIALLLIALAIDAARGTLS